MRREIFFRSVILIMIMCFVPALVNAQVKDKSRTQGMSSPANMAECMNQIVSDTTMRSQMMTKIMDSMQGDSTAMEQMCRKMMSDPGMHETMMKIMHEEGMKVKEGMGGKMQDRMDREKVDSMILHQHP